MKNSQLHDHSGLTARYLATAVFLSLGGVMFGLDAGGLSGFLAMPAFNRDFGTYSPQLGAYAISANMQLVFNLGALGLAVLSCLVAGEIGSRFGRRAGYIVLAFTGAIGAALQLGATKVSTLIVGKVFLGCVYGLGSSFVPMFLSETSPAVVRGIIVSLFQASINFGQLLASAVNWATWSLESRWAYRGPFVAELLVPIIILSGIMFVPESPRWLMTKGRAEDAAKSFRKLRSSRYPEEAIQAEVADIAASIEEERRIDAQGASWAALFQGPNRRRTTIVVLVLVFAQYSGISFLTSYGTYFFVISGIKDSWMVAFVLNVMGIAGSITSVFILKWFGRRQIMLVGGAMQCISMFTFAIVGTVDPGSITAARTLAAFTLLYEYFYTLSWGSVGWIIAAEVPSNELRSKTLALGSAVNWLCTFSLAAWLPYALNPTIGDLGAKLGFIFGPCIAIGVIWMYFYLPETGGRTLEQLDELFIQGVPARKSANYQYTRSEPVPSTRGHETKDMLTDDGKHIEDLTA